MIAKERDLLRSDDKRLQAGYQAEKQLAFYLARAFGNDPLIHIFNDLRLEQAGDAAQIDHLVLSRYGFVLVESKSVSDRFAVNNQGEWTRHYGGKAQGIASPVLQVQRQADFLKRYLDSSAPELIGKMLGIQTTFRTLPFDVRVAIADGGTISRPSTLQLPEVLKADQIPDAIRSLHAAYKKDSRLFGANEHRTLSPEEQGRIHAFLLAEHKPQRQVQHALAPRLAEPASPSPRFACKHCQGEKLELRWGKYGYYFKCLDCEGNIAVNERCRNCETRAKLTKQDKQFYAECPECGTSQPYFRNP